MKKTILVLIFTISSIGISIPAQAQFGNFLNDLKDNVDAIKDTTDSVKGLIDSVKGTDSPSNSESQSTQQQSPAKPLRQVPTTDPVR